MRLAGEVGAELVEDWREIDDGAEVGHRVRRWDPLDGTLLEVADRGAEMPKRFPDIPWVGADHAWHYQGRWRSVGDSSGELFWMPEAVLEAVRVAEEGPGQALWVFSGAGGLFALSADTAAVRSVPLADERRHFVPGTVTSATAWPLPWPLGIGEPSTELLERVFGAGKLRPLGDEWLESLEHAPTRRLLERVGWPVSLGIAGLYSSDTCASPPRLVDGSTRLLSGLGAFGSGTLLLDRTSGEIFVAPRAAADQVVRAAADVARFLSLLALKHVVLTLPLTSADPEVDDLARSARHWFETIEPGSGASHAWADIFDDLEALSDDYGMLLEELDGWE
ncbi:SUKH-4 family immunity protein [Streptomyces alkaliterrae]|uniref:SUKH-4 family immunity protein n=1 Tax=Streptomyces alkaliterrae TaxID=2213162 RepID=A0A7W3WYW8_9ACTN|nr:SUKH-4 family immunity protein [Streptomyces alkaliterrae]MBB1261038.1 SUKH-4 family immunity protein [Streptomyces alkaliterrae]